MSKNGTITDNQFHPAPRSFMLHGAMVTNPKAEHFAALNAERETHGLPPYLPIVDEPPTTDAAHYAVPTGWTRDGETWRRQYEVRAYPPPPPRRWTRLAIKTELAQTQSGGTRSSTARRNPSARRARRLMLSSTQSNRMRDVIGKLDL